MGINFNVSTYIRGENKPLLLSGFPKDGVFRTKATLYYNRLLIILDHNVYCLLSGQLRLV